MFPSKLSWRQSNLAWHYCARRVGSAATMKKVKKILSACLLRVGESLTPAQMRQELREMRTMGERRLFARRGVYR